MEKRCLFYGSLSLVIILSIAMGLTLTYAAPWRTPSAQGGAPTVVSYQGTVRIGDTPYDGTGYFKFAIVDSGGSYYWSNDGTNGEPSQAISLNVSRGLFSVLLGDTSLSGMTQPLNASVFDGTDRYLRVWFSTDGTTFTQMPDVPIASVPYALQAEEARSAASVPWSGVTGAPDFREKFANVVVVARSGGDFTSIQDAIDSITNASADNPYLVWVAPGRYDENVTMKPYVHLQGAGRDATIIYAGATPSVLQTLVITHHVTLRDLTVWNPGGANYNTTIRAHEGTTDTIISDVKILSTGDCSSCQVNWALAIGGPGTSVTLHNVTAQAEGGQDTNAGLVVYNGASVSVRGGSFTAKGGTYAYGINVYSSGTFLGADGVYALASGAASDNFGLYNLSSASAFLQGGYFRASGGSSAYGIYNNGATLEAEGITALGEQGADTNGLYNAAGSTAILRGGSFKGIGGSYSHGIRNFGTVEAHDVSAKGEGASSSNTGWKGEDVNSVHKIYGGTFTGQGGNSAYGIVVVGTTVIQNVYASGEGGTSNYGFYAAYAPSVDISASCFKGATYAMWLNNSTVNLALSQVDGGINRTGGTLKCFNVYNEDYDSYNCP